MASPLGPLWLLFLGASASPGTAAWSLGPAPAWTAPIAVPPVPAAAALSEEAAAGTYDLLFDHQVRVGDATSDEYFRRVILVISTAGVQNASEIAVDFDPTAERLVLHHVAILREGRDVSTFRAADVSLIRPERESEDRIYSGSLSALVFLRDVRPGDVLDYAYTLVGTAPSGPPSFAATFDMGYAVPVGRLRHRLTWPASRPLQVRSRGVTGAPSLEARGPLAVYDWTRNAVPAVVEEDGVPAWLDAYPAVELSEFGSWGDVAGWAAALYTGVEQGSPALDALVTQLASGPSLEQHALAAVRFVQDDVRYLGLEIGPGAFRPRPPAEVLARRYGDCKDKALLLSVLLRRLGLDARPALVSTSSGRGLDARLPSPFAFDHVIVRVKRGPKTLWIDATAAHQGGRLESLVPAAFERALVVDPSTRGLEAIPEPPPATPTTLVDEDYSAPFVGPAMLRVTVAYRGADADSMRATLADASAAELARSYLNHYAQSWPEIQAEGALAVSDAREENRIEIRGTYRIPSFWAGKPLHAWSLADALQAPGTPRRSMPLAVAHPTRLAHRFSVRLPAEPDELPADAAVEDPAFRFSRRSSREGRTLATVLSYESAADAVRPGDMPRYLADLEQARASLAFPVARPTGARRARRRMGIAALAGAPALLALWTLVRVRRRARRRAA